MISTVRKIPILRYALIVALIVVLFISSFYLYLYYRRAEKVRYNVNQMIMARESAAMIDDCLINLYSADNSSRLYALTSDEKYLKQFNTEIGAVNKIINQLNKNSQNQSVIPAREVDNLIGKKAAKVAGYIRLKHLSDSLLVSAGKINITVTKTVSAPVSVPVVRKVTNEVKIDTFRNIVKTGERRRKLFGRIVAAFSFKKRKDDISYLQQKSPTVVRTTTQTRIVSQPSVVKVATAYHKNFQKLSATNNELNESEQEILQINNELINQIISSLKIYKVAEQRYISSGKNELNNGLEDVVFKFKKLSGLIIIFLLSLVIIILFNIWKIFQNETQLITYSQDAEQYALSKTAFLASMSHEIRTPLNSVIGFSEQLSQGKLDELQKEQLKAISSSSKLLLEVVNEILDFSKFETGKMSFDQAPFEPYSLITEVLESIRIQARGKGIGLDQQINIDEKICVRGDSFRLKQVILNLLSNAIKFTSEGNVTLRALVTDSGQGQGVLRIQVRDSGVGISKENIPLIFGEFAQVSSAQQKASQKGTGLGLAISKKIIELQGGSIKVTSVLGKGSVFSFQLPVYFCEPEDCKKIELADSGLVHGELKGRHVLIAEDNELNVFLLKTILKKKEITFDVAMNGVEAITLFESNDYDILLTDIEMPELDGMELAKYIRQSENLLKSKLPILALTANVLKEDRDKYMSSGINGIVVKPFSEKNLLDNLAAALFNA